eukprot:3110807-Prymnesium_polylepis.1
MARRMGRNVAVRRSGEAVRWCRAVWAGRCGQGAARPRPQLARVPPRLAHRPGVRPDVRPGVRPDIRPGVAQHDERPGVRPVFLPVLRPVLRPG